MGQMAGKESAKSSPGRHLSKCRQKWLLENTRLASLQSCMMKYCMVTCPRGAQAFLNRWALASTWESEFQQDL